MKGGEELEEELELVAINRASNLVAEEERGNCKE
jgi:hypothetical protein